MQDESLPDSPPSSAGVSKVVRLTPKVAPIFSLVADSQALGASHNQVFCGNLAKSVVAWEPPDRDLIPKVHLNSHTGWVRALATSRQWLFRSVPCSTCFMWHYLLSPAAQLQQLAVCWQILSLAAPPNEQTCHNTGKLLWEVSQSLSRDQRQCLRVQDVPNLCIITGCNCSPNACTDAVCALLQL